MNIQDKGFHFLLNKELKLINEAISEPNHKQATNTTKQKNVKSGRVNHLAVP